MYLYPNCKLLVVYIICNNVTHYLAFFPTFYLITPIPFLQIFLVYNERKKEIKDSHSTIREITKHEKQETTFCSTLALVSLQYFFLKMSKKSMQEILFYSWTGTVVHQLFIFKPYIKLEGGEEMVIPLFYLWNLIKKSHSLGENFGFSYVIRYRKPKINSPPFP